MIAHSLQPHTLFVPTTPYRERLAGAPQAGRDFLPLDGVVLSEAALRERGRHESTANGRTLPKMAPGDLPPMFVRPRGYATASDRSAQSASSAKPGASGDRGSILEQIKQKVQDMWSTVAKAIGEFSKALPKLQGAKGETMRAIINALRGFGGLAEAISTGNIKGAATAAKSFGGALKTVAKRHPSATGLGFLLRRGGAFMPVLGTALEGHGAYRAIQKSVRAARAGDETAAAVWAGSAAIHSLAATLSGTVDLLLALTVGTAAPAYVALSGVVSGLGAVADIAGELAE